MKKVDLDVQNAVAPKARQLDVSPDARWMRGHPSFDVLYQSFSHFANRGGWNPLRRLQF